MKENNKKNNPSFFIRLFMFINIKNEYTLKKKRKAFIIAAGVG
jgi:hypothetical protein